MKAKVRALIILSLLCVILGALYAFLPGEKTASGPESENAFLITDIPVSELLALAITNRHGSLGILNSPGGIRAVSDTQGDYDLSQLRALVYLACHLTGRPLDIRAEADDIANSLARFSLILTGGREYYFAVLRQSPVNEDYFLFSEEAQAVFLVSGSEAQWFLKGAEDFLE